MVRLPGYKLTLLVGLYFIGAGLAGPSPALALDDTPDTPPPRSLRAPAPAAAAEQAGDPPAPPPAGPAKPTTPSEPPGRGLLGVLPGP